MRRAFHTLVVVLIGAAVVFVAWAAFDLPPAHLIAAYGLPPTGGPTGRTRTTETVEFVELKPGYFRMGSHYLCEEGDLIGRICAPLGLPWGRQSVHGLSSDWERLYDHPIHYLETFTDPQRFAGTCYRAANWVALGLTTGRGKDAWSKKPNRPLKLVWGYTLTRRFRQLLSGSDP